MAKKASAPSTELMRQVAARTGVSRPAELERLLVEDGVLHWQQARNVGRWWNGSVHPNSETTIRLLVYAGMLEWPTGEQAERSLRSTLEEHRDRLARPAKPRSSRGGRRAAGS